MVAGSSSAPMAATSAVSARASRRSSAGGSDARPARSPSWATPGARSSSFVPRPVSVTSRRRRSRTDVERRTSPASTRRCTTTDTELWWVAVASASSPIVCAPRAWSWCSTKSCAPLTPKRCSAARDVSRRTRTMRRIASIAARIDGSAVGTGTGSADDGEERDRLHTFVAEARDLAQRAHHDLGDLGRDVARRRRHRGRQAERQLDLAEAREQVA